MKKNKIPLAFILTLMLNSHSAYGNYKHDVKECGFNSIDEYGKDKDILCLKQVSFDVCETGYITSEGGCLQDDISNYEEVEDA